MQSVSLFKRIKLMHPGIQTPGCLVLYATRFYAYVSPLLHLAKDILIVQMRMKALLDKGKAFFAVQPDVSVS